jgi:hypothetical protein
MYIVQKTLLQGIFFENYEKWGGKDAIRGACDFDGHGTHFS